MMGAKPKEDSQMRTTLNILQLDTTTVASSMPSNSQSSDEIAASAVTTKHHSDSKILTRPSKRLKGNLCFPCTLKFHIHPVLFSGKSRILMFMLSVAPLLLSSWVILLSVHFSMLEFNLSGHER